MLNKEIKWKSAIQIEKERRKQEEEVARETEKRVAMENAVEELKELRELVETILKKTGGEG